MMRCKEIDKTSLIPLFQSNDTCYMCWFCVYWLAWCFFVFFLSFCCVYSFIISDQVLFKMIDYFIFAFCLCHHKIDLMFLSFFFIYFRSFGISFITTTYYYYLCKQHTLKFICWFRIQSKDTKFNIQKNWREKNWNQGRLSHTIFHFIHRKIVDLLECFYSISENILYYISKHAHGLVNFITNCRFNGQSFTVKPIISLSDL